LDRPRKRGRIDQTGSLKLLLTPVRRKEGAYKHKGYRRKEPDAAAGAKTVLNEGNSMEVKPVKGFRRNRLFRGQDFGLCLRTGGDSEGGGGKISRRLDWKS